MKGLMSRQAGGPERVALQRAAAAIGRLGSRDVRGKVVVIVE